MWTHPQKQSPRYVYSDVLKGLKTKSFDCMCSPLQVYAAINETLARRQGIKILLYEANMRSATADRCQQLFLNRGQQSMVNSPYLAISYHDKNSVSVPPAQHCNPSLTTYTDTPNTSSGLSKSRIRSCFYMIVWWKGKVREQLMWNNHNYRRNW